MRKLWIGLCLTALCIWGVHQYIQTDDHNPNGYSQGEQAPDFQLTNLKGSTVALADYAGKTVVLNFWATWCEPCRDEMPHLQKFYEIHGDSVTILAVNYTQTETRKKNIAAFAEDFGITFPMLLDEDNKVVPLYGVHVLPVTYIIEENGIIQHKITGGVTYEWLVNRLQER